jgi:hypothetical protein
MNLLLRSKLKVLFTVATGSGLEAGVRFPAGKIDSILLRSVQTGRGALSVSYKMGTCGFLPGSKAAGALS